MADGEIVGPVKFALEFPETDETIARNIAHAKSLGLPELFAVEPLTLNIIATGPSAADAPLDGPTLAVNNALKSVFLPKGFVPTYWMAVDPQPEVASFLPDEPPKEVTYLVASKCDPSVFEKLKGCDVRTFDILGQSNGRGVKSACSVTLTAMTAFVMMGVKRFNIWGWDGCYADDGSDHAGEQYYVKPECGTVRVDCGPLSFTTTRTWANEAQDALMLIPYYEYFGVEVNIHGRSMLKAIREFQAAPEAA